MIILWCGFGKTITTNYTTVWCDAFALPCLLVVIGTPLQSYEDRDRTLLIDMSIIMGILCRFLSRLNVCINFYFYLGNCHRNKEAMEIFMKPRAIQWWWWKTFRFLLCYSWWCGDYWYHLLARIYIDSVYGVGWGPSTEKANDDDRNHRLLTWREDFFFFHLIFFE